MPHVKVVLDAKQPGQMGKQYYAYRRLRRCCLERHDKFEHLKLLPTGGQGQAAVLRRKSDKELIDDEPEEVRILRDFLPSHERIMELLDYSVDPENVTLFYRYYNGGDLYQMIEKCDMSGVKMPEKTIWEAFRQLTEALAFLHYGHDTKAKNPKTRWRQIYHRDIKPENVLLRSPVSVHDTEQALFVLADFGLATTGIGEQGWIGTAEYQPPEGSPATEAADIWALGSIIHCMAHRNEPPIIPKPSALPMSSTQWARDPRNKQPRPFDIKYSSTLEDLMLTTLKKKAEDRIDSLSLLKRVEHEFRPAGQALQGTRNSHWKVEVPPAHHYAHKGY